MNHISHIKTKRVSYSNLEICRAKMLEMFNECDCDFDYFKKLLLAWIAVLFFYVAVLSCSAVYYVEQRFLRPKCVDESIMREQSNE